jgi:hypothetical protein
MVSDSMDMSVQAKTKKGKRKRKKEESPRGKSESDAERKSNNENHPPPNPPNRYTEPNQTEPRGLLVHHPITFSTFPSSPPRPSQSVSAKHLFVKRPAWEGTQKQKHHFTDEPPKKKDQNREKIRKSRDGLVRSERPKPTPKKKCPR